MRRFFVALLLALWAGLAPAQGVVKPGAKDLCPVCGIDRNVDACDCAQPATDSRWDALRELSERLGGQE